MDSYTKVQIATSVEFHAWLHTETRFLLVWRWCQFGFCSL